MFFCRRIAVIVDLMSSTWRLSVITIQRKNLGSYLNFQKSKKRSGRTYLNFLELMEFVLHLFPQGDRDAIKLLRVFQGIQVPTKKPNESF